VLVALPEEFLVLREGLGTQWCPRQDPEYGGHLYFWIDPDSGYRCVAASSGRMGPDESLRLAERLLRLRPAALVNVGIAASLHGDVRIGDVVVPDMVYAYDKTAKAVAVQAGETETWDWEPRGDAFRATHALVEAARELVTAEPERHDAWQTAGEREFAAIRHDNAAAIALIEARRDVKALRTRPEVSIVYLGSGNFVGAAPAFARWLRAKNADIKALEMEAAGMLISAVKRATPTPALVLRGISDHVDVPKAESDAIAEGVLRRLAMRNAVRLMRALLAIGALPRHDSVASSERRPAPEIAGNPFKTGGTLPADHPSYIARGCDEALAVGLGAQRLCAVEGDFGVGKSSLVMRVGAGLMATHRVLHVHLAFRSDDIRVFMSRLFKKLSRLLGRTVEDWSDLAVPGELPVALVFDEFGSLTRDVLPSLIPPLIHFVEANPPACVVVCLPVASGRTIQGFLADGGVVNPKHRGCWRRIEVPRFSPAEVERLLELLPPRARELARTLAEAILRRTSAVPVKVQRLCSELYEAEVAGKSDAELQALITAWEDHDG